jgi:hypothetical protein
MTSTIEHQAIGPAGWAERLEDWANGIEAELYTLEQVRALNGLVHAAIQGHSNGVSTTDLRLLRAVLTEQTEYMDDSGIAGRVGALTRVLKAVSAKSCDRISPIDMAAIVFLVGEYVGYAIDENQGLPHLLRGVKGLIEPEGKEG